MNGKWIRIIAALGVMGLMAAPAAAQRVRLGFNVRLSDRAEARVALGSRGGPRVAVRYGTYGSRARRARARHDRHVRELNRELDRLLRRTRHVRPREAARAYERWIRSAVRRHGHSHAEWEIWTRGRGGGQRGNLRPVRNRG